MGFPSLVLFLLLLRLVKQGAFAKVPYPHSYQNNEEIPVDTCMRKWLVWKSVIAVINLSRILIIVNFAVKVFVQVVQFKKHIIETCTIKKNIPNSVQASTKREQGWFTYELGCAPLLVFLFWGLLWRGNAV